MEPNLEKLGEVFDSKDYVVKEFNSIRNNWPNLFVGVVERTVRYSDKTLDGLLAKIRSDKGSTEGVFMIFVPSKQETLVV